MSRYSFPPLLQPVPPVEAFGQTAELLANLAKLPADQLLLTLEDSRQTKEQVLARIDELHELPDPDSLRSSSLETLAAGLLCGALDGAALYRLGHRPKPCRLPDSCLSLQATLQEYLTVADEEWRQLDADALQLQAGYGKHLNRLTHEENVQFVGQPGRQASHARRALFETFRTGYSLGLIDSAIVIVTGERPDPLESE